MEVKFTLDFDIDQFTKDLNIDDMKPIQTFLANEVMRLADDYVPMDSGLLKNTAFVTPLGDAVVYPQIYANYLYEGFLMVDPITKKGAFHDPVTGRFWSRPNVQKELTDTPLKFAGAPKRGAHWVERMMEDHEQEIVESLGKFIESRYRNGE